MALLKVKGNIERLFDKNLNDLVRGIRNHKEDEAKYIASCLEEIKQELRQHNLAVKTNAVAKLTYLQMLGYDIRLVSLLQLDHSDYVHIASDHIIVVLYLSFYLPYAIHDYVYNK